MRALGLPPPGARSSFARQPVRPRPIPIHAPRSPLSFSGLFEDPGTAAVLLWILVVVLLGVAGLLPMLVAKTRIARSLIMLAFWAQATRSSASLADAAGEGLGNLRR